MGDISRRITRKSLKAKKKAAIKTIKAQAKEKIHQVKVEYSIDAERKRTKAIEKEQKKELKVQKANARLSYNARQPRPFSLGEDLFNSISHGIGAGLSVAGLVLLIVRSYFYAPKADFGLWVTSYTLFGSLLFIYYLASTLSHAISAIGGRKFFERITFMSMWALIPAISVPFSLICFNGKSLTPFIVLIWSIYGLMAILYAIFGDKLRGFSIFIFFASFFAITLVFHTCGLFFVSGSLLYLLSALFFKLRNYKWSHSIFHLLILAGSISYFFVFYYWIMLCA